MQRANNKAHTIRALMKNEKMAALMRDAINSPLGSTPRKRAQSIVSIMQKVGALDNQPAHSSVYRAKPQSKSEAREEQMRRAPIVFGGMEGFRIPSHGRGLPEKKEVHDGAGGPGFTVPDQYVGMFSGQTITPKGYTPNTPTSTLNKTVYTGNMAQSAPTFGAQNGTVTLKSPLASSGTGALPSAGLLAYQAKAKSPEEEAKYREVMSKLSSGSMTKEQAYAALGIGTAATFPGGSTSPTSKSTASSPSLTNPISGLVNKPQDVSWQSLGGKVPQTGGNSGASSQGAQGPQQEVAWPDSGSGSSSVSSEYDALLSMLGVSGTDADPYSSITNAKLHDAVTGHTGASAFAYSMMNDAKELRKLPGFENVPDDALPYGASLVGQTNALAETLRKEFKLDALLSQHMSLVEGGTTLQTDLTDYIRGRDEFLNETQGLIDNFKDNMLNGMDMANPVIAQRAEQYGNYLYTLKGRQNKRYIEFLNSSVDMYNNKLAASKDTLTTALDYYERDLKAKTDIATEEFGMYYQMLTDMYTEASGLPDVELARAAAKAQIVNTYASSIGDTADSADIDYTKEYSEQFKLLKETAYDKDGKLLPASRNIADLFVKYGGNQVDSYGNPIAGSSPIDPKVIFDAWGTALQDDFASAQTPQDAMNLMDTYLQGINQFRALDGADAAHVENARQLAEKVGGAAVDSIYKAVTADESQKSALKEAVQKLTHPGFLTRLGGGYTKQDLKDDYGAKLGVQFLDKLYSQFEQYIATGGKDAAWHFYADPSKYPADPGMSSLSDSELIGRIIANSFSGMKNIYAQ